LKRVLVALLLLFLAGGAAAEEMEPVGQADLGDLLREAEAGSPMLRAAEFRLEAARRLPSQVQTPPDPEASIAYTNVGLSRFTLGEDDFAFLALTWTQEVPYPGKLRKAGEVAALEAEVLAEDLERARLEVAATVKIAFADLYRLDRTAEILSQTRSALESLSQTAQRRYEVGQGTQESILKAQTEILRLEAEVTRVARDRRAAEVRLSAAVGRADDTPIGPATMLPTGTLPENLETLADAAATASPEVARLEANVRRGEANLQLARLGLKPDFVWSASYGDRGGFDPMVTGMFGVRLPIRRERKQAQAVLQAESELAAARQDLAERLVAIRAKVRDLVSRVQRTDRIRTLFDQGVIPQARNTLESAQASYGVGRIAFLDLLTDLTVLLNARIDHASHEAEWSQALAALEPLLGRELIQPPGGPGDGGGKENAARR